MKMKEKLYFFAEIYASERKTEDIKKAINGIEVDGRIDESTLEKVQSLVDEVLNSLQSVLEIFVSKNT